MEQEVVEIDGENIIFFVQRKNVKNINLKVTRNKEIIMSIPKRMKIERAREFVKEKINWIRKQQNFYNLNSLPKESKNFEDGENLYLLGKQYKLKVISSKENKVIVDVDSLNIYIKKQYFDNKNYIKKFYEKWLKEYSLSVIKELVLEYQRKLEKYGIDFPEIEIKRRKSVWGSCIPLKNKVIFNSNLIKTPMMCVKYVVLHELSHFKYQNHSKEFYNFVAIFMPDWKEMRKILNKEWGAVLD